MYERLKNFKNIQLDWKKNPIYTEVKKENVVLLKLA